MLTTSNFGCIEDPCNSFCGDPALVKRLRERFDDRIVRGILGRSHFASLQVVLLFDLLEEIHHLLVQLPTLQEVRYAFLAGRYREQNWVSLP